MVIWTLVVSENGDKGHTLWSSSLYSLVWTAQPGYNCLIGCIIREVDLSILATIRTTAFKLGEEHKVPLPDPFEGRALNSS